MKKESVFFLLNKIKKEYPLERFILIGSQSLYGSLKEDVDKISNVLKSREIDVLTLNEELSEVLHVRLGEGSSFDREFGYYLDSIKEKEIPLPKNFKNRLVNLKINEIDVIQVLNIHDYIVCKLFAGREKDLELLEEVGGLSSPKINKDRLISIVSEYPNKDEKLVKTVFERIDFYF